MAIFLMLKRKFVLLKALMSRKTNEISGKEKKSILGVQQLLVLNSSRFFFTKNIFLIILFEVFIFICHWAILGSKSAVYYKLRLFNYIQQVFNKISFFLRKSLLYFNNWSIRPFSILVYCNFCYFYTFCVVPSQIKIDITKLI